MSKLIWLTLISILFAGCSGGGGAKSAVDGTPGNNKQQNQFVADAPICKKLFEMPESFNKSCSGGSNLNLCRMSNSEDPDKTICLFDNRSGVLPEAYRTVTCVLNQSNSCPSTHDCVVENCEETAVCARVASKDLYADLIAREEAIPGAFQLNGNVRDYRSDSTGDSLFLSESSEVLLRTAQGQWINLHEVYQSLKRFYPKQINVIDNVFYLYGSTSFDRGPNEVDSKTVFKVENEKVTLVEMPSDISGQTCGGKKVRGCFGEIYKLWKDSQTGLLSVITEGRNQFVRHELRNDTWLSKQISAETANKIALSIQLLDGSHLYFDPQSNKQVYVSANLRNWATIPVPPNLIQIIGFAADDIWARDYQSKFHRWTGRAWQLQSSIAGDRIVKFGKQGYLVSASDNLFHVYQQGCWQTWKTDKIRSPVFTMGPEIGFISNSSFKVLKSGFEPEY